MFQAKNIKLFRSKSFLINIDIDIDIDIDNIDKFDVQTMLKQTTKILSFLIPTDTCGVLFTVIARYCCTRLSIFLTIVRSCLEVILILF